MVVELLTEEDWRQRLLMAIGHQEGANENGMIQQQLGSDIANFLEEEDNIASESLDSTIVRKAKRVAPLLTQLAQICTQEDNRAQGIVFLSAVSWDIFAPLVHILDFCSLWEGPLRQEPPPPSRVPGVARGQSIDESSKNALDDKHGGEEAGNAVVVVEQCCCKILQVMAEEGNAMEIHTLVMDHLHAYQGSTASFLIKLAGVSLLRIRWNKLPVFLSSSLPEILRKIRQTVLQIEDQDMGTNKMSASVNGTDRDGEGGREAARGAMIDDIVTVCEGFVLPLFARVNEEEAKGNAKLKAKVEAIDVRIVKAEGGADGGGSTTTTVPLPQHLHQQQKAKGQEKDVMKSIKTNAASLDDDASISKDVSHTGLLVLQQLVGFLLEVLYVVVGEGAKDVYVTNDDDGSGDGGGGSGGGGALKYPKVPAIWFHVSVAAKRLAALILGGGGHPLLQWDFLLAQSKRQKSRRLPPRQEQQQPAPSSSLSPPSPSTSAGESSVPSSTQAASSSSSSLSPPSSSSSSSSPSPPSSSSYELAKLSHQGPLQWSIPAVALLACCTLATIRSNSINEQKNKLDDSDEGGNGTATMPPPPPPVGRQKRPLSSLVRQRGWGGGDLLRMMVMGGEDVWHYVWMPQVYSPRYLWELLWPLAGVFLESAAESSSTVAADRGVALAVTATAALPAYPLKEADRHTRYMLRWSRKRRCEEDDEGSGNEKGCLKSVKRMRAGVDEDEEDQSDDEAEGSEGNITNRQDPMSALQLLINAIVANPYGRLRHLGHLALVKIIAHHDPQSRFNLLQHLLQFCPYENARGLLFDCFRAQVRDALGRRMHFHAQNASLASSPPPLKCMASSSTSSSSSSSLSPFASHAVGRFISHQLELLKDISVNSLLQQVDVMMAIVTLYQFCLSADIVHGGVLGLAINRNDEGRVAMDTTADTKEEREQEKNDGKGRGGGGGGGGDNDDDDDDDDGSDGEQLGVNNRRILQALQGRVKTKVKNLRALGAGAVTDASSTSTATSTLDLLRLDVLNDTVDRVLGLISSVGSTSL